MSFIHGVIESFSPFYFLMLMPFNNYPHNKKERREKLLVNFANFSFQMATVHCPKDQFSLKTTSQLPLYIQEEISQRSSHSNK
jgi:hypothetical protein